MSVILRPYQVPAVAALVKTKGGVVKSPAGSGKTVIGAAAIEKWRKDNGRNPQVIWFAHTNEQVEQAKEALWKFGLTFALTSLEICCYQSGKSCKGYDIAVLDECHHIASPEFRKILDGYQGIKWGLSATPDRADEFRDDVYTLIGPIVHEVPRDELVDLGQLAQGKVYFHAPNDPSEMDASIEEAAVAGAKKMDWSAKHLAGELSKKSLGEAMRVLSKEQRLELMKIAAGVDRDDDDLISEIKDRLSSPKDKETLMKYLLLAAAVEILSRARWHACQSMGVFENQKRNIDIVRLSNYHRMLGDSSIVLVGSIEHGKLLAESIPDAVVCYSKMGAKKRRDAIAGFRDGSIKVMIATSLADEGLDVPRANVIIMGAAGRSESKTEQRSGRVMRTFLEKTHGIVHDFWDWQHPLLLNQSRARAKVYFALKYQFESTQVLPAVLKAIGVKFHPSLGMTPAKKPRKKSNQVGEKKKGPSAQAANSDVAHCASEAIDLFPLSGNVMVAAGSPRPLTGGVGTQTPEYGSNPSAQNSPAADRNQTAAPRGPAGGAGTTLMSHPAFGNIRLPFNLNNSQKDSKVPCGLINPDYITAPSNPPGKDEGLINPPVSTQLDSNYDSDAADKHSSTPTGPAAAVADPAPVPAAVSDSGADRSHSRLSPSTLKGKAICPGFFSDPEGDKSAANRGTLGHKAIETRNPDLCGDDMQLRAAVEWCIQYQDHIVAGRAYVQEIKVYFFDQHGYFDILVPDKIADLLDWKFAYNEYEADSPQFWAYCLGVFDAYPQVEAIRVHVVHPFLNHMIDEELFTRKDHYNKFKMEIAAIIAAQTLNDPNNFRITEQCAFCGFARKCAKLAQLGLEIGRRYAPELELPEGTLHGSEITDPAIIASLMRLKRPIEKAAKGWSKAALAMYDAGTDIPGFVLRTKKGSRSITDPRAAFDILKKHFLPDLTEQQFMEWCDVSATKLDELVEGAAPKRGKKAARETLGALLEDADALDTGGTGRFLKAVKETEDEDDDE